MPAFITFGRILFAVLFIYFGGVQAVRHLTATADVIAAKVVIPAVLAPYTSQLEDHDGHGDAADAGDCGRRASKLIGGLMIALNFGARFFAILLIFFVAAATFYFHDFWNQTGAGRQEQPDPRAEKPVDHRRAVHDRRIWPGAADGGAAYGDRLS